MKKLLLVLGLMLVSLKANAVTPFIETIGGNFSTSASTPSISVVGSSATVGGVICTTGTPANIGAGILNGPMGTGFSRAWVRVGNSNATNSVFLGFNSQVSSDTLNTRLGEELTPKGSATYSMGIAVSLFCLAADAAGANGIRVSFAQFGYR